MDGGKLVFSNNKTCVFKPKVPCPGKRKNKSHITKVVLTDKEAYEREKKMNEKIKRIKSHKEWALIFDEFCDVLDEEEFKKHDKDITLCNEALFPDGYWGYQKQLMEKFGKMLTGEYGGITFENYFNTTFSRVDDASVFFDLFAEFVSSLQPLFLGLVEMKKHKMVHCDVKDNNIVYDEDNHLMKFIDFGLTNTIDNHEFFDKRVMGEFFSDRLYVWYPLEFLMYYANKNGQIDMDIKSPLHMLSRPGIEFYILIHRFIHLLKGNVFDEYEIHNNILQDIRTNEISEKEILEKVDIYGLGFVLLLHLINYLKNMDTPIIKQVLKNELFNDFMNLFIGMIEPDVKKRMAPEEAYDMYIYLSQKHLEVVPVKKTPVSRPRRTRSRMVTRRRETVRERTPLRRRRRGTVRERTPTRRRRREIVRERSPPMRRRRRLTRRETVRERNRTPSKRRRRRRETVRERTPPRRRRRRLTRRGTI